MKDIESRISESVDEFMALLQRLVGEMALQAIDTRVKQQRAKPPRVAKGSTGRRSQTELQALAEQLYAEMCARPGERMLVLAKALGQTSEALSLPVQRLVDAGRVRKTGSNQHTRYFPIGRQAKRKRR